MRGVMMVAVIATGTIVLLIMGIRVLLRGRRVPAKAKLMIAGALVWVLSPLDPIPDVVPAVGVLDDLLVLIATVKYVLDQLQPSQPDEHPPESRVRGVVEPTDWRLRDGRPSRDLPEPFAARRITGGRGSQR